MCDMTHSCVGHDSFIHVTWLSHKRDITYSYLRHDWQHSYVWNYSTIREFTTPWYECIFIHVSRIWDACLCMCDAYGMYVLDFTMRGGVDSFVWYDTFICMKWLNYKRVYIPMVWKPVYIYVMHMGCMFIHVWCIWDACLYTCDAYEMHVYTCVMHTGCIC